MTCVCSKVLKTIKVGLRICNARKQFAIKRSPFHIHQFRARNSRDNNLLFYYVKTRCITQFDIKTAVRCQIYTIDNLLNYRSLFTENYSYAGMPNWVPHVD